MHRHSLENRKIIMFGYTFKIFRFYVALFIVILFIISSDFTGTGTSSVLHEELDDLCFIFSHNCREILLRLNRIKDFIKPLLVAASVVELDKAILLPVIRIVFLVTGFGKYLLLLLITGFVSGRILRAQALEDFRTPVILKIAGGFSYELASIILIILFIQSFISCAYILTTLFLILPALCGIKIGSAC